MGVRRPNAADLPLLVELGRQQHLEAGIWAAIPYDFASAWDLFVNAINPEFAALHCWISEGGFILVSVQPAMFNRACWTAVEVGWFGVDSFALLDTAVKFCQDCGLKVFAASVPKGPRSEAKKRALQMKGFDVDIEGTALRSL